VIRAKESARNMSLGEHGPVASFKQRHRSVDPRTANKNANFNNSTGKRLNIFQPKGSFGIGSNEMRYEEYPGGLLKDPSVKF
jgi:hypothetical protein